VDVRWQLGIGAGREFQVDGPATAKLQGPSILTYNKLLVTYVQIHCCEIL